MSTEPTPEKPSSPLREIIQPFIDLVHAPRALWGINLAYLIEGFCYFGILQYLAMYFQQYAGLDDIWSQRSKMVLTAGITIAMFFLGGRADKWGVRFALLAAFCLMIVGRFVLAFAPQLGGSGMTSPMYIVAVCGLLVVVLGYGMYQPAAYAAVRQFTTPATAGMGFAMLYALMNLGGWLPTFMSPMRNRYGIESTYWFYAGMTVLSLVTTGLILSRATVRRAIAAAGRARMADMKEVLDFATGCVKMDVPCVQCGHSLKTLAAAAACPHCATPVVDSLPGGERQCGSCGRKQRRSEGDVCLNCRASLPPAPDISIRPPTDSATVPAGSERGSILTWLRSHPLADAKFAFFIFCLIPVQTLFAYNFGTIQAYVDRAYRGEWIGRNFEAATNLNALLIFVLVPIVTALTQKRKVYNMMIIGTFVMAAPTFLLAAGTNLATLGGYIVIMTIGEAMWQPRFLQYAAEIAPEGRTGAYMGVAQLPWFLTKIFVPLYEGWFLQTYCPQDGPMRAQTMWLVFGCIAMASTFMLILAKGWIGKDFKAKAA